MPSVVSLKIDFKFDNGVVRIIDIGPGLSADHGLFPADCRDTMIQNAHEMTGAAIAPIFGEFLSIFLSPKLKHVPIVLRKPPTKEEIINQNEPIDGKKNNPIVLVSHLSQLEIYLAHVWNKFNNNLSSSPPIAFSALDGYKIFWYLFMQQLMPEGKKVKCLFWCNFEDPSSVLAECKNLKAPNGYFIKIVNTSMGTGVGVYYAADEKLLAEKIAELRTVYQQEMAQKSLPECRINKIYVIEPAYVNLKQFDKQNYNPTGRAFITISFDAATKQLKTKVAHALWIFPKSAVNGQLTIDKMIGNIANSSGTRPLTFDENKLLETALMQDYGAIWTTCFQAENLFAFFSDREIIKKWNNWILGTQSIYPYVLENCNHANDRETMIAMAEGAVETLIRKNHYQPVQKKLDIDEYLNAKDQQYTVAKYKQSTLATIALVSFQLNYEKYSGIKSDPRLELVLKKAVGIYLWQLNPKFDRNDYNKALRQTAHKLDVTAAKLLIYTHLADVNDVCPTTNQTTLDIVEKQSGEDKQLFIQMLQRLGAKKANTITSISIFKPANNKAASSSSQPNNISKNTLY